jgi:hypothetical protein
MTELLLRLSEVHGTRWSEMEELIEYNRMLIPNRLVAAEDGDSLPLRLLPEKRCEWYEI